MIFTQFWVPKWQAYTQLTGSELGTQVLDYRLEMQYIVLPSNCHVAEAMLADISQC